MHQNQQNLVAVATSLEGSKKNNFRLITTNPQNLAKIGPVDFEIIGLAGIVKNELIYK